MAEKAVYSTALRKYSTYSTHCRHDGALLASTGACFALALTARCTMKT